MTCKHHWDIATPTPGQPRTPGVCRDCGTQRTWLAYMDEAERLSWRSGSGADSRPRLPSLEWAFRRRLLEGEEP